MAEAALVYADAFSAGIRPDPPMTVDEWADEFRYLSAKASAEPGRYRTDRTPFLREIMQTLSPASPVQEIVFMKSAQIGGSEAGFNWLGFIIDRCPGPTMMVQPRVEDAERVVKQRIGPMLRECPTLRGKLKQAKANDEASETILMKDFPGGCLLSTGANSGAGLRSMPAKFIFMDEIDAYPADVDGEGNPVDLAAKRADTFPRRKVFKNSTPTYKGASNIEDAYEASDKRRFHVPCPHCGELQWLKFKQLKWDKNEAGKPLPATARYECEHCREKIPEHHKTKMLEAGRWIAENPGVPVAGFHISALYSPLGWCSWAKIVRDWYKAKDKPERLKVFVNTVLGETYEVKGEDMPEWRALYARREGYPMGLVPRRAVLLTAACDVQNNRLEVTLVAWSRKESWVVAHEEIAGDTSKEITDLAGPWPKLSETVARIWPHASGGGLSITLMAIDSGFRTARVYEFVRSQNPRQVIAIKGQDELAQAINLPSAKEVRQDGKKRIKRGVRVWGVGSSFLKAELYARLKYERPTTEEIEKVGWPKAYVHFPELSEEYFKQLTAEKLVLTVPKKGGRAKYQWVKTQANAPNEALDLMVYNLAAFEAAGAARWSEATWRRLEADFPLGPEEPPAVAGAEEPAAPVAASPLQRPRAPAPPPPPRRESTFWGTRR